MFQIQAAMRRDIGISTVHDCLGLGNGERVARGLVSRYCDWWRVAVSRASEVLNRRRPPVPRTASIPPVTCGPLIMPRRADTRQQMTALGMVIGSDFVLSDTQAAVSLVCGGVHIAGNHLPDPAGRPWSSFPASIANLRGMEESKVGKWRGSAGSAVVAPELVPGELHRGFLH
jgi:hypothetical protein